MPSWRHEQWIRVVTAAIAAACCLAACGTGSHGADSKSEVKALNLDTGETQVFPSREAVPAGWCVCLDDACGIPPNIPCEMLGPRLCADQPGCTVRLTCDSNCFDIRDGAQSSMDAGSGRPSGVTNDNGTVDCQMSCMPKGPTACNDAKDAEACGAVDGCVWAPSENCYAMINEASTIYPPPRPQCPMICRPVGGGTAQLPWVAVSQYGLTDSGFQAADMAAAAANMALLVDGEVTISSSYTMNAPAITFSPGGMITTTEAAPVVTLPTPPLNSSPSQQLFNTTAGGSIVFQTVGTIPCHAEWWGAAYDGTTDDSAAFLSAWIAISGGGGGTLLMPAKTIALAQASSLDLSPYPGVTLLGSDHSYGYDSDISTAAYSILINSGYSPSGSRATGYTLQLGSQTTLRGIRLAPSHFVMPTTLRTGITAVANYVGTGLTLVSGAIDVNLEYVMVNGFTTAIANAGNTDRVHLDHVAGDDTNFLNSQGCGDTCTATQIEAWDFLTSPYNVSPQWQSTTISSFSAGPGGVVEVTLASAPATPFVDGDIVIIGNTTTVYQRPNGRHVITAVDATHFTLNGTVFVADCPSGCSADNEIAYITVGMRRGTGFLFSDDVGNTNSWQLTRLVEYGHDIGLVFGESSGGLLCSDCWFDGDTAGGTYADPVPIGIVNGAVPGSPPVLTQQNRIVGAEVLDKAISIYNNSASPRPLLVANSVLGIVGSSADVTGAGISVFSGSVFASNVDFEGDASGGPGSLPFAVYAGASLLRLDNARLEGSGTAFFETPTDCPKFQWNGVISCTWTPVLVTGGTVTHADGYPIGTYVQRDGNIYLTYRDQLVANTNPTAENVYIAGLPVAATDNSAFNGCNVGPTSGITLSPGYTQMYAAITGGQTVIALDQFGSAEPAWGVLGHEIGDAAQISLSCQYQIDVP